jgi:hypothetical protein
VRRLPWPLLVTTLVALERRRRALQPHERRRLLELLAKSRARPWRLTGTERNELMALVHRLDPMGVGRELVPWLRYTPRRGGH